MYRAIMSYRRETTTNDYYYSAIEIFEVAGENDQFCVHVDKRVLGCFDCTRIRRQNSDKRRRFVADAVS